MTKQELIPITKENYKEVTIALWEHLSAHSHSGLEGIHNIKKKVLTELGYTSCRYGCPLCEVKEKFKIPCVLVGRGGYCCCETIGTPYQIVCDKVIKTGILDSKLALNFLNLLKEKLGSRGI